MEWGQKLEKKKKKMEFFCSIRYKSIHNIKKASKWVSAWVILNCYIQRNLLWSNKGMLFYCFNNIQELYFCGERVSMVNERHSIWTIPTIQFNAATTLPQTPYIGFNWGLTGKLIPSQVAATEIGKVNFSLNITVWNRYILYYCSFGFSTVQTILL
jgi:hypothetical protein